jgi:hypothetical protein
LQGLLVYNADGTLNEAGAISDIVDVVLQYPDLAPDLDDTDCDNPGPGGGKPDTPAAADDK